MASPRLRRTVAALALISSLGLLPAAEAGTLSRPRWQGPVANGRQVEQVDRSLAQALWSFLTGFWAKAGAKIDGNG